MNCPFRYIDKGRTFCAIAILDSRYNTTEVSPSVCADCRVPALVGQLPCANLDLGVSIMTVYGGARVEEVFTACRARCEQLKNLDDCSKECPDYQLAPRLASFVAREADPN